MIDTFAHVRADEGPCLLSVLRHLRLTLHAKHSTQPRTMHPEAPSQIISSCSPLLSRHLARSGDHSAHMLAPQRKSARIRSNPALRQNACSTKSRRPARRRSMCPCVMQRGPLSCVATCAPCRSRHESERWTVPSTEDLNLWPWVCCYARVLAGLMQVLVGYPGRACIHTAGPLRPSPFTPRADCLKFP